ASARLTRGSRHRNERLWQQKAREQGRLVGGLESGGRALTPGRRRAVQAWCEIAKVLASSEEQGDRELGRSVVDYARCLPGVRYKPPEKQAQRELPGLDRSLVQKTRPDPGWER
ncbi:MAG: hypothetical protein KGN16_26150, partial [Burkholderiales bacterium]|nr:hypothetical protein [Burkholderiales bacterium]